jgi:hypothetical protein
MSLSLSLRASSFLVVGGLAALLAGCGSPPPPAAPPPPAPDSQRGMGEHAVAVAGTNLQIHSNLNQTYCFDAKQDQAKAGTQVWLYQCDAKKENQRWTFSDATNGQITILGIGGLCLDVKGHAAGDGTPLQLMTCDNQANQKFKHEDDGRIREVATGKCLTTSNLTSGAPLVIDECNKGNGGQVWTIQK